jgi:hypothetical protein
MSERPKFTEEPAMGFKVAMGDIIRGDTPPEKIPEILAWARKEIGNLSAEEQKEVAVHLENATRFAIDSYRKACHEGWDAVVYPGGKRGL